MELEELLIKTTLSWPAGVMARRRFVGAPRRRDNPEPLPTRPLAVSLTRYVWQPLKPAKQHHLSHQQNRQNEGFMFTQVTPRGYSRTLGSYSSMFFGGFTLCPVWGEFQWQRSLAVHGCFSPFTDRALSNSDLVGVFTVSTYQQRTYTAFAISEKMQS